jgi:hypothetical protein
MESRPAIVGHDLERSFFLCHRRDVTWVSI